MGDQLKHLHCLLLLSLEKMMCWMTMVKKNGRLVNIPVYVMCMSTVTSFLVSSLLFYVATSVTLAALLCQVMHTVQWLIIR